MIDTQTDPRHRSGCSVNPASAGAATGSARHPLARNQRTSPFLAQVFHSWLVGSAVAELPKGSGRQ